MSPVLVGLVLWGLVLVGAVLGGCSAAAQPPGALKASSNGLRANLINTAIAKPAVTLTDTGGRPYDLRSRTAGRVTLLFFGYTHCPDVCPAVMADIAVALRQMAVVRSHVTVVFVTSDPARDTSAVIKTWLAHFDQAFVGLTGSITKIYAAARSVGVPLETPETDKNGTYTVNHGSQVLAFGLDGKARVIFTPQSTPEDYAHDLPLLVDGKI